MTRKSNTKIHQTPPRNGKRRGDDKNSDGSSPEKCPKTPSSKAAELLSKLHLETPSRSTRSHHNLKSVTVGDILRHKSPTRVSAKNLFPINAKSPARRRSPPRLMFLLEDQTNVKMEIDENQENMPPNEKRSVGRPRKNELQKTTKKNAVDKNIAKIPKSKDGYISIKPFDVTKCTASSTQNHRKEVEKKIKPVTPVTLKKDGEKSYRVSHTPKAQSKKITTLFEAGDYRVENESTDTDDTEDSSDELSESSADDYKSISKKNVKVKNIKVPKTLEDLRTILHTSVVPDHMPCRDNVASEIEKILINGITKNGKSQAVYISGGTGLGKTTTTSAVVKELQKKYKFDFITVNALELMEPHQLFVEIYQKLVGTDKRISASNARKKLNMIFGIVDKRRLPVVILIDELDMLCTKKQDILYDVFNWVSSEDARVTVITIANTLDLPERVLDKKIASRLGINRVVFQPYLYNEIMEILRARMSKAAHLVDDTAIEFISKKIGNIDGDFRRVLDLLSGAIEVAIERKGDKLTFAHVIETQKESKADPRNVIGRNLSRHGFILFRAALAQCESTGVDEFMFSELYKQYYILCTNLEGINPLNDYAVHQALMELCSNRMLIAGSGSHFSRRKIRLGMMTRDALPFIKQVEDDRKERGIC